MPNYKSEVFELIIRDERTGDGDGGDVQGVNKEEKEIIEDTPPEVEGECEAICKLGDVWQLGKHRLMCGDSTDNITVEKLMNGEKADMVFTDPPYGYEYKSNVRRKSKKFEVLKNDDKILDFIPAIKMCVKVLFLYAQLGKY